MKNLFYISVLSLAIASCGQEIKKATDNAQVEPNNVESTIKPLNFDPGATTFTVDAAKGDTVFLENGGTVIFDSDAFVDKEGNLVKGKVDVAWQEFHSMADIVASGIPMKYDSAGVANDLVSGGMFTIKASQKGEQLEMAQGKGADVSLVSLQDTPCYNFYELDEKSGKWSYETTKSGTVVEEKDESSPEQEDGTIIEAQLSLKDFPELEDTDMIGWKTEDPITKGTKNWIKQTSTKMRILKHVSPEVYVLEAKSPEATKTFRAKPYTKVQAIVDSKKNRVELDIAISEIEEYQKKMAAGKVVRNIRIEGFGTYNWDIICKRANSRALAASFEFPEGVNKKLITMSLISPEENAVVSYNPEGDPRFSFDPNKKNCLIGILPSNELVVVSNDGFRLARKLKNGSPHTFKFKKTGIKLESPADLKRYIDRLI